jgi:hypothetical protein
VSTLDRKALREQLASADPETITEALAVLLDAIAEHAKALKLSVPEFLQQTASAFAESRGEEFTEFEIIEERDDEITVVIALSAKWRRN